MLKYLVQILLLVLAFQLKIYAHEKFDSPVTDTSEKKASESNIDSGLGVSTNPSTVNIFPGTGELGKLLFKTTDTTPIRLGGVWLADGNAIATGGADLGTWSGNNLGIIGIDLDFEKLRFWKGGLIGASFLQFNGMNSNEIAGSIQAFDSMAVTAPFNRSQLYELWYRQVFLDDKLVIRVGKMIPTYDFNNVLRPAPLKEEARSISSVSSLLYTPVFIEPTNLGVMPGYYNSACGVTISIAPTENYYLTLGAFDGNLAKGVQTGMTGPHFNGYYFYAGETGISWLAGEEGKPGNISVGGWIQTGKLSIPNVVQQKGAQGLYLFGAQRLWFRHSKKNNSGISAFWQLGINHAKTLPMNKFIGGGLTAFSLTRPKDSFGMGVAWSWLNHRTFTRKSEFMLQGYYQAHIFKSTYIEPVFTYIPTPGGGDNLPQTFIFSAQLINLF